MVFFQSTIGNSFMFTGRMWDDELGLYDYRARIYNPKLGVFYQTDPLGYHDSTNMYAYCVNDPVNFVDPFGLMAGLGIYKTSVMGNNPYGHQEKCMTWGLGWASYNIVQPFYNTLFYPGYNYGEWVYGEKNLRSFYGASLDVVWLFSGAMGAVQSTQSVTALRGAKTTKDAIYIAENEKRVGVIKGKELFGEGNIFETSHQDLAVDGVRGLTGYVVTKTNGVIKVIRGSGYLQNSPTPEQIIAIIKRYK